MGRYASRDPRPLNEIAVIDEQTIGVIASQVPPPTNIPHGNIVTDTDHAFISEAERIFWNDKQDELIPGTNIKNINGEAILGSGNIEIAGTGGFTLAQARRLIRR